MQKHDDDIVLQALQNRQQQLSPADAIATGSDWQHWRLSRDGSNVAWLIFDQADSRVNALNEAVLQELGEIVAHLRSQPASALVLRSAKTAGFCAGADIGMFRDMTDAEQVRQRLQEAHAVVDALEQLPITRIALVHGQCLGGGLELALACDYRIAIQSAKLGFPEVLLGLHPGLGGTFRSTRLISPLQAMTLMLTGKSVSASRAKKLGLVDAVTEERHALSAVHAACAGSLRCSQPPAWQRLLQSAALRPLLARSMEKRTRAKVSRQHYPAPFNLINIWNRSGGDTEAMQQQEIKSFANLVTSAGGQNLVRVFFLREALKHKSASSRGGQIRHVHVIGAGAMGGDIAAWCALRGLRVSLGDRDPNIIAAAMQRAAQLCRRKRFSGIEQRDMLDRLIPDVAGDGIAQADLIIEAVPEKIAIKQAVYEEVQARIKAGAIIATNTSSIPLETLRQGIKDPSRFLGLHFFNPVAQMLLVELVTHDQTSAATRQAGADLIGSIDRLPVPVRSAPGFLVNRVLTPYLLEAIVMLDEGVQAEAIDKVALDFGMPVGPLELADQVGLDICLAVGEMLREGLDSPIPEAPQWLRDKVKEGHVGRKSGAGIYTWQDNKAEKSDAETAPQDCSDRLILPLLNTCVSCLREGIVEDEETLDAAMIFGTGFAPFTGGPLHYARARGIDDITSTLQQLQQQYGDRFAPDSGWQLLQSPPAG